MVLEINTLLFEHQGHCPSEFFVRLSTLKNDVLDKKVKFADIELNDW